MKKHLWVIVPIFALFFVITTFCFVGILTEYYQKADGKNLIAILVIFFSYKFCVVFAPIFLVCDLILLFGLVYVSIYCVTVTKERLIFNRMFKSSKIEVADITNIYYKKYRKRSKYYSVEVFTPTTKLKFAIVDIDGFLQCFTPKIIASKN